MDLFTDRRSNEDLALAYQAGDRDAAAELISRNMGLVGKVLRRLRAPLEILRIPEADITQTAIVGLLDGSMRYRPGTGHGGGAKWSSYVYLFILGAVSREIKYEIRRRGGRVDDNNSKICVQPPLTRSLHDIVCGDDGAPLLLGDTLAGGARPDEAVVDADELVDALVAECRRRRGRASHDAREAVAALADS